MYCNIHILSINSNTMSFIYRTYVMNEKSIWNPLNHGHP